MRQDDRYLYCKDLSGVRVEQSDDVKSATALHWSECLTAFFFEFSGIDGFVAVFRRLESTPR